MAKLGPGARIGDQFLLLRKIGEGGCGEVYLAEQTSLGRNTVVKLMHPELSRDPSYVARFRREAQLAARLSHHHVASIYAFGETPERVLWIAMEYIEGDSLHNILARDEPREVAGLLSPVADVLDRAGALGIIHRDVKPDNIIVSPEGQSGRRAVLLDFGLARPMEDKDKLTQVGVAVGSPTYMSPEQVFGPSVDSATDRYAFGIILYMSVARRPPFRHDDRVQLVLMHKRQPVPALHTLVPQVPPNHPLDAFFTKALAKQPQDRHASARQMVTEFQQALDEAPLFGGAKEGAQQAPPATSIGQKATGPQQRATSPGAGGPVRPPPPPPRPAARPAPLLPVPRPGARPAPLLGEAAGQKKPLPRSNNRSAPPLSPLRERPVPAPPPESGEKAALPEDALAADSTEPTGREEVPAFAADLVDGEHSDPTMQTRAGPKGEGAPPAPAPVLTEEEDEEDEEPPPGHKRLVSRAGGMTLDVLCATEALLGKHRDCELVCRAFPTPEQDSVTHGVSRQHARLRVASGKLFVEDLASLNGTFLDDKRLTAGPVPLYDEARLRLGPVLCLEVRLFRSGAALIRRVDPYHGDFPPTLLLWDKLALGEPLLGLVPATGDSVTRWGVMQNSRPNGDLWWGGPKAVGWDRGGDSPARPQALQPGDRLSLGSLIIEWMAGAKPGI